MNRLEAYHQQLEAEKAARQAARAEHQAWLAEVAARRDAQRRGELPPAPGSIPRLAQLAQQSRVQNAVAERERRISVVTGPHAFLGQGMRLPPGSAFAPSKYELVNGSK